MNQTGIPVKPRILVAPLDWGLGHATRCIPVIRTLLHHRCTVFLAGDDRSGSLLLSEFPGLPFIPLKGYDIRYSRNRLTLPFVLGTQIPKILSIIKYEKERLEELVKEHALDAVISDNRYGLCPASIPSVFITHQLLIKTPFGQQADRHLQRLNYSYINRFTECWVPDNKHDHPLAGQLSHPSLMPATPVKYIGPLSRFSPSDNHEEKHLLVLLSGPEPQRTILENLLLEQLETYQRPVVLARGMPGDTSVLNVPPHVTVHHHLPAEALKEKIAQASFVIARCGYSTVMDLAALNKKSILIPTPGQTEQEYLATHLSGQRFALCIDQHKFKLNAALSLAGSFPYNIHQHAGESHLDQAVQDLLRKINTRRMQPGTASQ
jgi:uncharacterized protein (TIGR00661 family)